MNEAMRYMNRRGFWIPSSEGKTLGAWIMCFLQCYACLAKIALEANVPRWALMPKHHVIHHTALELYYGSSKGLRWVMNPLSGSNQMQEDFVGKPSRLSRRVAVPAIHSRVLQRSLISVLEHVKDSDVDKRGLM